MASCPDYADKCIEMGYAPIKPEFLVDNENFKPLASNVETEEPMQKSRPREEEGSKPARGQNKKRRLNVTAARNAGKSQLCMPHAVSGSCKRGDACDKSHDLLVRLSQLQASEGAADALQTCPFASKDLPCPYGINCEANALSHVDATSGVNLWRGQPVADIDVTNNLNKDLCNLPGGLVALVKKLGLNKKQPQQAAKSKLANVLSEDNKDEESQGNEPEANLNDTAAHTNCIDVASLNENRRVLKSKLQDKLILAPLTTVGNLPFRRLCIGQGCDATNSEMILATSICQLKACELAMLKRHESEKLFGIQVAGGFCEPLERACQIIVEGEVSCDWVDLNVGCPIDGMQNRGSGCILLSKHKRLLEISNRMSNVLGAKVPFTLKTRTGYITKDEQIVHRMFPQLFAPQTGLAAFTLHGRTAKQRYTRGADWDYIGRCKAYQEFLFRANNPTSAQELYFEDASPVRLFEEARPAFIGNGDIYDFEQYNTIKSSVDAVMIGRGALTKPWLFREIKEQRRIDLSSRERFELLQEFCAYGLEYWGSDRRGVETTRRFLLEELSFFHRYIPLGVLARPITQMNLRPPAFNGRDELETLLGGTTDKHWIELSRRLLGDVPEDFVFIPKHKSSAWTESF